jgi:hypothetical protein
MTDDMLSLVILLMVAVLAIVLLLAIPVRGLWRNHLFKALDRTGTATHGEIIQARENTPPPDDDEVNVFFVVYRYMAPGKDGRPQTFTRKEGVDGHWYGRLRLGEHVPIHYLPRNPQIARMDGNPLWWV